MSSIESLEPRIAPATFSVTNLDDSGIGSLRGVVAETNDHPGADVIIFKKGLTGTISITNGQIAITDALTIKGPGAGKLVLDANFASRIFFVSDSNPDKDSPLTVSGLTFYRGFQDVQASVGGAIASVESLNVKNCVFLQNEANGNGGAISVINTRLLSNVPLNVDIRDSSFMGSHIFAGSGGAISAELNGTVKLMNNVFSGNVAHDTGGAVILGAGEDQVLLVQDCRFLGNRASQAGAASLIGSGPQADGTVVVRGSLFSGNSSTNVEAGALGISGGEVLIDKTTFSQNTATGDGGALDAKDYASLSIRSSRFVDNVALGANPDSGGGGIHLQMLEEVVTRVIASIISGNTATVGGGILVDGVSGRLEIIASKTSDNHATESGGGICVLPDATINDSVDLSITRSKIINNAAESNVDGGGGVFFFSGGVFKMMQSQVSDNNSFRIGGGLLLINTEPATINGSLITENSAFGAGGGVWAEGPIQLRASEIVGNFADVGGGVLGNETIELTFCLVSRNFAGGGGGIAHPTGLEPILNHSKVIRNISIDGQQISGF
jgi:predicted outer membrane repeat protein